MRSSNWCHHRYIPRHYKIHRKYYSAFSIYTLLLAATPIFNNITRLSAVPTLSMTQAKRTHSEWHESYGHLPFAAFALIPETPVHLRTSTYQCQACIEVKRTTPPLPVQGPIRRQTTRVGELVHGDLFGPRPTEAIGGQKYMLTLVDDYSRFTMAKAIHERSDAAATTKAPEAEAFRTTRKTSKPLKDENNYTA